MTHIPQGITFGSKVAVLPGYSEWFTHSEYTARRRGFNDTCTGTDGTYYQRPYNWIKRGEPIANFKIRGSYGNSFWYRLIDTKLHSAPILCPVSGLLLDYSLDADLREDWNSKKHPPSPLSGYAILLPDDEPKPESGKYMYQSMCNLIRAMSHYYFKNSRYWTMLTPSPEELDNAISLQLSANPLIFDALPSWSMYLDEARTKKPELRPYLKHLANC